MTKVNIPVIVSGMKDKQLIRWMVDNKVGEENEGQEWIFHYNLEMNRRGNLVKIAYFKALLKKIYDLDLDPSKILTPYMLNNIITKVVEQKNALIALDFARLFNLIKYIDKENSLDLHLVYSSLSKVVAENGKVEDNANYAIEFNDTDVSENVEVVMKSRNKKQIANVAIDSYLTKEQFRDAKALFRFSKKRDLHDAFINAYETAKETYLSK